MTLSWPGFPARKPVVRRYPRRSSVNERPDLNLPDLVGLLQDTVTHLQAANQYQAWWWAIRPPVWGVQRALERTRNCAACGLPIAIGQPYWIWSMDGGLVTHTGVTACARVALAIIGLAR